MRAPLLLPTTGPIHGIWRILPSPPLTEIIAQCGLHFQIFDCEHGSYDFGSLAADMAAGENQDCVPWVRVSGRDKIEVQRCLDLGARGVVFPQLETYEDFVAAAEMMDYPPAGSRGYNPCVRALDYGSKGRPPASPADHPWFVPIIETLSAVADLDRILGLPRIDLVYIGSFDLSAQLGRPGAIEEPEVTALIGRILDACTRAGRPVGMIAPDAASRDALLKRGVRAVVHGVDAQRIKAALGGVLDLRS